LFCQARTTPETELTVAPETHYLNTDFDVSLRPRPGQLRRELLIRQVRELSIQALFGASEGDSVLLRAELPGEFLEYLGSCGIRIPNLLAHPRIAPETRLNPFGWNAEAIELNRSLRRPSDHPPLSVIGQVNSRSFAHDLQLELESGDSGGAVVSCAEELDRFLKRAPADSAWMLKAEHGNSGLGNRRLRQPILDVADSRFVSERLAEDDRLVVEPWRDRERDWCAVFDAPFSDSTLRIHETICTRDGALIGALFSPNGTETVTAELGPTAERVASRLVEAGYFGPVCLDAFHWNDNGQSRLRPLVDLNCRRSMSGGVHRLWRDLADGQTLFYRFFNRRKLNLPEELPEMLAALGDDGFDRQRRQGTILASPPRLGSTGLPSPEGLLPGAPWRPGKLAVIFVAGDRAGVFELERRFRERFEG
jgi:hypothetical protein